MRTKAKFVLPLTAVLLLWGPVISTVSAATYYVDDVNGLDSRTTVQAQSIDTPWKTIGKAASEMDAGDTVYIRGGIYYETAAIIPANSGDEFSGYITFQNYQDETVTLDGTAAVNNDPLTYVFKLAGKSYIRVIGFRIVNYIYGVNLESTEGVPGADHIEFRHCYIDVGNGNNGAGLLVKSGHDLIFADIELYDCKNGIGVQGIKVNPSFIIWAYNVQILDVYSHDHWGPEGDGVSIGNYSHDILISGCEAHNTNDDGIDVRGYNITVENCIAYNCTYPDNDAHGIKCYGIDPRDGSMPDYYVRVEKCLSYNNDKGIFLSALGGAPNNYNHPTFRSKEIEVTNCTFANNEYGVYLENEYDEYPLKPYIYNTISSGGPYESLFYEQASPDVTSNYNLWWVPGLDPIFTNPASYSSYLIENPYEPGSWYDDTGNGLNSHSVDPNFADEDSNDFELDPVSVCIDAGTDVGLPYVGSAPDMGAFEAGTVEVNCPANYLTTGENWISIPVAADNAQPYSVFDDLGYWPNCVYHNLYRYNSPTAGFAEYPTYQSDAVQFGKIVPGGAYKLMLGGNQPTIHVSGIELKTRQTLTVAGTGTRVFYFGDPFNKVTYKNNCRISYNGDEVSIDDAISNGWVGNFEHFNPASKTWEVMSSTIEPWHAYRLTAYNTSGELKLIINYAVAGDLNGDGDVDWDDVDTLSEHWLVNDLYISPTGDINGDLNVDFKDFAILAGNWLVGT